MKPKVSIIVPVYNVEKYLDRCMESLLNQTLKEIEIILVDDGSPDNCPQMCDEYAKKDSRVKVVHKANAGLGYARNSGLEIATGVYVAFVDSDDYVDLDAYQTMYDEAVKVNADYVCCGYKRVANGKCVWEYKGETNSNSDLFRDSDCIEFLKGMIGIDRSNPRFTHFDFAVWHGIYLRRMFEDYKVRFCSERDLISEDIVFHLDFITHCKSIRTIPNTFYNYCLNEGTLTTKYKEGRFDAIVKLYTYIRKYVEEHDNKHMKEGIRKRLDAFFFDKVNSTLSYESNCNKSNPLNTIKLICNNKEVRELLKRIDSSNLDKKKQIICALMKYNLYFFIYWIFKLK